MKNSIVLILILSFIQVSFSQQCPSEKVLTSSKRNFLSLSNTDSNDDKFGVSEDNTFSLNVLSEKEQQKINTLDPKFEYIYPKPKKIGIERKLEGDVLNLLSNYSNIDENYREMLLISPNAKALRLHFSDFHHDVDSIVIRSLYQGKIYRHLYLYDDVNDKNELWSAMLPNDKVYIRIYGSEQSEISIDGLVHIYDSQLFPEESLSLAELSCHLDVMCYSVDNFSRDAVGQINFVSNGSNYVCTGTILNDTDNTSFIPYFLTAYHCISTQTQVNSMEVVWLYQKSSCNGSLPNYFSLPRNLGGTLLATSPTNGGNDMTFVRLAGSLPTGVSLSGWTTNPLPSSVHGIHHPGGSWKRYTLMHEESNVNCTNLPTNKYHYCEVDNGITEGGSSGSGLFDSSGYLYGQLYGVCYSSSNPPDCSSSAESFNTIYGKFSETFPLIQTWLQPTDLPSEDIYLSNLSLSDYTLDCGDVFTAYATQNYSGSQLDANLPSFDLDYYLSANTTFGSTDILLGGDISSLGSDDPSHSESQSLTLPSNLSPGTYYILFVADADGELTEDDEGNNIGYITITVSCPMPDDIYLTNLSLSDYTLDCGDVFTAYGTQNYSGSQLDANLPSFDLDYYLSTNNTFGSTDILLGGDISSLGSDDPSHSESQSLTLPSNLSPGTYYIIFVADADEELVEDNENNNTYYISIQVSCITPQDLYTSNNSVSDSTPSCGQTITVSCNYNYSGGQTSSQLPTFDLKYYLSTNTTFDNSDILMGSDISPLGSDNISDSESDSYTLPSSLNPGTYYILFLADANGELNEGTNESNNVSYLAITVSCNYSITTVASPTSGGSTIGSGTYSYGSTNTVSATANAGWTFTNWTVNGVIVSTSVNYSFILTEDIIITANFTEDVIPCISPSNINIEMTSATSAFVSWNAVSGATLYQVWYRQQGTSSWSIKGTANTQRNIPDLIPYQYYEYKVRAKCADNTWSDFSDVIVPNGFCDIPAGITAEMTDPTTALASWNAVWEANYYQVWYRKKGDTDWIIKGTANTQRNMPNLIPNKYYQYKIRARCIENTWSDFSDIYLIYSNMCPIPTGISSVYLDNNRMKIRWDNTNEVKARVGYREVGTSTWYTKNSQPGNNFVYITGLTPNGQYEYKVRSNCQDTDWSAYSNLYIHNLDGLNAREAQEIGVAHTATKIYPNPVKNILNIDFPSNMEGKTHIAIMDNLGREKFGKNIMNPEQRETVDISNLPNGYYFLVIANEKHTEVLKFMKIK